MATHLVVTNYVMFYPKVIVLSYANLRTVNSDYCIFKPTTQDSQNKTQPYR